MKLKQNDVVVVLKEKSGQTHCLEINSIAVVVSSRPESIFAGCDGMGDDGEEAWQVIRKKNLYKIGTL